MSSERPSIRSLRFFLLAISCLVLLASGCTSSETPQGPTPTPTAEATENGPELEEAHSFASITVAELGERRLSRVNVIPNHAILPAGETTVLSAIAYNEQGTALDPDDVEVRWRMIDPQAGTVTITGVFRAGFQRGVFSQAIEVSISQEVDGRLVTLQALASVSVIRPLSEQDISRVQVLPGELQVGPETNAVLTALALDRDGVQFRA